MPRKKKAVPSFDKVADAQRKLAEAVFAPLDWKLDIPKPMPDSIAAKAKVVDAMLETFTAMSRALQAKATPSDKAGMVLAYREMQQQVETYVKTSECPAKLDLKVIERLVNDVLEVSKEIKK